MKSHLAKKRIGDDALAARTGKRWREWFKILDEAGAKKMDHKAIVAVLSKRYGPERGWWWQMITVGYEQERGRRRAHEKPEGFEVSSSKTIAASLASLYRAWTDAKLRKRWLAGAAFSISKATPKKSVHIVWGRGPGRVEVMFYPRGAEKNQVTVQHGRLPTSAAAQRMQSYWKQRLEQLRGVLEK